MTSVGKDGTNKAMHPMVVIGMLGIGKTKLCQSDDRFADADFGTWCEQREIKAYKLNAVDRRYYAKRFVREAVIPLLAQGKIVLTNEPDVWRQTPLDVAVMTVTPSGYFRDTWYENVLTRIINEEPDQLTDQDSFFFRFLREGKAWPDDERWSPPGVPHVQVHSYCQFRKLMECLL